MTQAPPYPPMAYPAHPPVRRRKSPLWKLWPGVPDGAPWPVFAAAAGAALLTVLTEPYAVVGVAGLLTGLAVAAAPVAVVAASRPARQRLLRPLPVAAGLATLTLLAVGAVRANEWLYVLSVLTALGLGSYGLAAGRRWPSVLAGGAMVWLGALRGIPWLSRGLTRPAPSVDQGIHIATRRRDTQQSLDQHGVGSGQRGGVEPVRAVAVVVVTVVLLLVFGSLLVSADAAFARGVSALLPEVSLATVIGRGFVGFWVAVLALGAAFTARVPPRLDRLAGSGEGRLRTLEWAVPVAALTALFAAFTVVQFAVLFGGDQHVQVTPGLTYADYARKGFGQLVLVTLLTLAVLALVGRLAPRETPADRVLVRVIPGALCLFTLVIVASALYRMHLYQEAYGFTALRLLVSVFELWLGALFLLILAAGARLRGGWLPRAVVGTGVAALLGLAALNPDRFVAEQNVARYQETGKIDTAYLRTLSADAAPVLDALPEPYRSCALGELAHQVQRPERWYAYNVSRASARDLLAERPVDRQHDCGHERY